jgi:hypothetical protein
MHKWRWFARSISAFHSASASHRPLARSPGCCGCVVFSRQFVRAPSATCYTSVEPNLSSRQTVASSPDPPAVRSHAVRRASPPDDAEQPARLYCRPGRYSVVARGAPLFAMLSEATRRRRCRIMQHSALSPRKPTVLRSAASARSRARARSNWTTGKAHKLISISAF